MSCIVLSCLVHFSCDLACLRLIVKLNVLFIKFWFSVTSYFLESYAQTKANFVYVINEALQVLV